MKKCFSERDHRISARSGSGLAVKASLASARPPTACGVARSAGMSAPDAKRLNETENVQLKELLAGQGCWCATSASSGCTRRRSCRCCATGGRVPVAERQPLTRPAGQASLAANAGLPGSPPSAKRRTRFERRLDAHLALRWPIRHAPADADSRRRELTQRSIRAAGCRWACLSSAVVSKPYRRGFEQVAKQSAGSSWMWPRVAHAPRWRPTPATTAHRRAPLMQRQRPAASRQTGSW